MAAKYLFAVQEAGRIYRHIAERRKGRPFITEVSMDETAAPQTPPQLLVILAALADEGSPPRPSRPSSPAASTRAWTTWATWPSSSASFRTTWP